LTTNDETNSNFLVSYWHCIAWPRRPPVRGRADASHATCSQPPFFAAPARRRPQLVSFVVTTNQSGSHHVYHVGCGLWPPASPGHLTPVRCPLWTRTYGLKFNSKRPAIASFACFLVRCCRLAGESADFVPGSPDDYAAAARALAHFPGADHANSQRVTARAPRFHGRCDARRCAHARTRFYSTTTSCRARRRTAWHFGKIDPRRGNGARFTSARPKLKDETRQYSARTAPRSPSTLRNARTAVAANSKRPGSTEDRERPRHRTIHENCTDATAPFQRCV
jgi:hypothetical protein